jgi:peptide deformylase
MIEEKKDLLILDNVQNAEGQPSVEPQGTKSVTLRQILKEKYDLEFSSPEDVEQSCTLVTNEDLPGYVELTKKMLKALTDIQGAGLAGIQVGVRKAFFVWWKRDQTPQVAYNPAYYPSSKKKTFVGERCLTYGVNLYKVSRYKEIRAVWFENEDSKLVKKSALMSGDNAIVFQHETDHTNGVTINVKGELIQMKVSPTPIASAPKEDAAMFSPSGATRYA